VFARINGRETLASIAQSTNLSEFDVCRVVYGFVTAGLVEVMPKGRPATGTAEASRLKRSLVSRIIKRVRSM
jgi:DNA-binding transcriptional regulator LsrR (DeoR family)